MFFCHHFRFFRITVDRSIDSRPRATAFEVMLDLQCARILVEVHVAIASLLLSSPLQIESCLGVVRLFCCITHTNFSSWVALVHYPGYAWQVERHPSPCGGSVLVDKVENQTARGTS